MASCAICHDETGKAYVCLDCTNVAAAALARLAGLAEAIESAIARESVVRPSDGRGSGTTPEAIDLMAMEISDGIAGVLSTWLRHTYGVRCLPVPTLPAGVRPVAWMAELLADDLPWLRWRAEAPEAIRDVMALPVMAARAVDLAESERCLGPCPTPGCEAMVYAAAGSEHAWCRTCHVTHVTRDVVAAAIARAEDTPLTLSECAAAMALRDIDVPLNRLNQWAHKGRIMPCSATVYRGRMRSQYRLKDVISYAERMQSNDVDDWRKIR